jgi:AraC-like DNA-binding protein
MFDIPSQNPILESELSMCQCGSEDCKAGHFYGPAVRDHFLIHYVRSGRGLFRIGNKVYQLQKGQGFLICPDIVTFYQADYHDPWSYSWVGFHGKMAEYYLRLANLNQANPIFNYDLDNFFKDCLEEMIKSNLMVRGREPSLKGLVYLFLSKLIEIAAGDFSDHNLLSKKEIYLKNAIEFIRMNYSRKITIHQIAHFIGLDRSYLCSLFKEQLHIGPQEYLIRFRINKACELMQNQVLTIGDISRSVGYDDQLQFSKIFRKVKGLAPRDFRKNLERPG